MKKEKKERTSRGNEEIMNYWKEHDKCFYENLKFTAARYIRALKATEFENLEEIDKAIALYEENLNDLKNSDYLSFKRLAIIYLKMGRIEDEIRVLEKALNVIPHPKLRGRLEKARSLKGE